MPVIAVATFLSLVPAVGTTMIWLLLVIILWTTQQYIAAIIMGCALGGSWGLSYVRPRRAKDRRASGVWLSFLLFMGLAAGLLTFGMKGFVIGPMLVVAVILVFAHLLLFRGLGKKTPQTVRFGPQIAQIFTDYFLRKIIGHRSSPIKCKVRTWDVCSH